MHEILPHKRELLSFLGNLENEKILDYGCGRGDFIELMLNHKCAKIHAVDSSTEMITGVESRFNKEIKSGIISTSITRDPNAIEDKFDKIICHNVLECVEDKINFVNKFKNLLLPQGILMLSHHDFDSAIYNSSNKNLTRDLIHNFADTKQDWQEFCDGQMGRKIPSIIEKSSFKDQVDYFIIRKIERSFMQGNYGYLMASMIIEVARSTFDNLLLENWYSDLKNLSKNGDYFFAIDLVVAVLGKTRQGC